MNPITAKDYMIAHCSSTNPDLVDQKINVAVAENLEDPNIKRRLKNVASAIAISDFRNLQNEPANNYWNVLKLKKTANQNAIDVQEASTSRFGDSVLQSYNTRARAEKPAVTEDEDVFEIDDAVLDGMEKSVESTIKSEAVKLARAKKTFSNLSEEEKDTVYLSLNSIVDLSNNNTAPVDQKFISKYDARRLIVPCFQASGLDGEVKIMKLHASGLYTIQHIGSVDIPSSINLLRDKKIIPRLEFTKKHCLKNAQILSKSLEKEARLKKKKSTSYRRSPSWDDVETSTKWTRSTWFTSPRASHYGAEMQAWC
ncbi:hypothetical protein CU098_003616, partial [Rhizopus stolonifer]